MRKSIIIGLGLGLCVSFNAYAGEWKQDSNGWWWQNDDGTFSDKLLAVVGWE